jgi:hypothetical protein
LPITEHHDDQRQGGRIVVLAMWNMRPGLERLAASPGEPAGAWRTLGLSRG